MHDHTSVTKKSLIPKCRYPDLIYSKLAFDKMQSGLRYRCCVDYVVEWMEHSSNLVVFCHTPSSMLTWSWLDSSDLYFFIRFNCGSKILLKSLILDQRSPTNYQWSNLQNPKPWFRKVTHCWRKDGTLDTTCVNAKRFYFAKHQRDPKNANEIPNRQRDPKSRYVRCSNRMWFLFAADRSALIVCS